MNKATCIGIIFLLFPCSLFACSAFFTDGPTKYLAKNFDWSSGEGYIIKNISGQKKFAYGLKGANQANWTSKFDSFTFNQIGKEFPYGGINEKGLVVEQLWMSESIYPDNSNQTISELEWIQYQLDNFSTLEEVIQNINTLTIKPIATIHYIIADRSGNSAVIDFSEGKAVVNKKQCRDQVITNSTLLSSESYFNLNKSNVNSTSRSSFDRFCQIKSSLSVLHVENPRQAFDILDKSAENREKYKTYWTIVYDLTNLKIYYKSYDNRTVKEFGFSDKPSLKNPAVYASNINSDNYEPEIYTAVINDRQFKTSIKMMDLKIDTESGAEHQMMPDKQRIDKIYQDNYVYLTMRFSSKSRDGNLFYTIISGEENFSTRKGTISGYLPVTKNENVKVIYNMPKGEFAIACFQDTDLDNKIDTKIFGIPKNYGFSRNKRGFFGTPPAYQDAKIVLETDTEITIDIK